MEALRGGAAHRWSGALTIVALVVFGIGCSDGDDDSRSDGSTMDPIDSGGVADVPVANDAADSPGDAAAPRPTRGRIAVGRGFSCALDENQTVVCWGQQAMINRPPASGPYTFIAGGGIEACVINVPGEITCWDLAYAAPGAVVRNIPRGPFIELAIGARPSGEYACARRASGELSCWRSVDVMPRPELTTLPADPTFDRFDLGANAACGVRPDGSLVCWGTTTTPVTMNVPTGQFVDVVTNEFHGCAIDAKGRPTCWGTNSYFAANFPAGDRAVQIDGSSYDNVTCALLASGSVYCSEQSNIYPSPTDNRNIVEIAVAEDHYCFVKSDRTVGCQAGSSIDSHAPPAGLRVVAR